MALDKVVKGYVCGIAWGEEVGHTSIEVHPTHKHLKKHTGQAHYEECAVIEIEMRFVRVVKAGET